MLVSEGLEEGSQMKKIVVVLGIALALAVGVALRSSLHARSLRTQMTDLQVKFEKIEAKLQPLESKRSASKRIMKEFDIPAGSVQCRPLRTSLRSTLSGKWRSSGEVRRGADDSISGFTLSDRAMPCWTRRSGNHRGASS